MKYEITLGRNMLTVGFDNLATAKKVTVAKNPSTQMLMVYADGQIAGKIVGVTKDGEVSTTVELETDLKKPQKISVTSPTTVVVEIESMAKMSVKDVSDAIKAEKERLLKNGILTNEELSEKLEVMKENRFSDVLVLKTLQKNKEQDVPVKHPKTIYRATDKTGLSILAKCTMEALMRHAVIYEGDKSVGKNCCAETVAWLLNEPYWLVSFNRKTTMSDAAGEKTTKETALSKMSEDDLLRLMATDPARAKAVVALGQSIQLVTEESELVHWLKKGGLLMMNEVNMADANFLQALLNPLADGTGFVELPGHGRVYMHPDCILVGSQNPEYTGAQSQNAATLSRVGKIYFPYPTSIKGALISATRTLSIPESVYNSVDKLYGVLYKSRNTIGDETLNIRGFVRAIEVYAEFAETGYSLADAIKTHVGAWVDGSQVSAINTAIEENIPF